MGYECVGGGRGAENWQDLMLLDWWAEALREKLKSLQSYAY